MKSSGIGKNSQRRSKVLRSLSNLDIHVLTFCVPKTRVSAESGLRFAEVFLKYTAKQLCLLLPRQQDIRVIFDSKGRPKFREAFEKYLSAAFPKDDLFRGMAFGSEDSKKCTPLQLADIYAGSVGKLYEKPESAEYTEITRLLAEKATIWEWPTNRDWGRIAVTEDASEFDAIVRREAFRGAWSFLENGKENTDEDEGLRCVLLRWLVAHSQEGVEEFMLSDEILRRIRQLGSELDAQGLRNRVIGPLRDAGILISSSSKGYRLPMAVKDIRRYVDLCNSQIPPALARVKRARDVIRVATTGRLDILDGEDLQALRGAVDSTNPF